MVILGKLSFYGAKQAQCRNGGGKVIYMDAYDILENTFRYGREVLAQSLSNAEQVPLDPALQDFVSTNAPQILVLFLSGALLIFGVIQVFSSLFDFFAERRAARGPIANRELLFSSPKYDAVEPKFHD